VLAREPHHGDHATHEAPMEGHAAFPELENFGRVLDEEGQIVEQHVAGAAADDDADGDPEDKIVELRQRDRHRAAPEPFTLDQRTTVDPADYDAGDIGE